VVESLIGTLVGALLAFATTWWVTPRLDRRSRAAERQEESIIELYRLLVEEAPYLAKRLRNAYRAAHEKWTTEATPPGNRCSADIEDSDDPVHIQLREARHAWWLFVDRLDLRFQLLADTLPRPIWDYWHALHAIHGGSAADHLDECDDEAQWIELEGHRRRALKQLKRGVASFQHEPPLRG